jgi:hypothetical protein
MSHKRADTLAKCRSWNKHLKPEGKRDQAKRERLAAKDRIAGEVQDMCPGDAEEHDEFMERLCR